MRRKILIPSLIVMLSGLAIASHGQVVVWSQNFDSIAQGPYGAHTTDFINDPTYPAYPVNWIVPSGTGNALSFSFDAYNGTTLNDQTATLEYAASGNTSANKADYTLSFDLAVNGVNLAFGYGGLEISVFGPGSWIFNGDHAIYDFVTAAQAPAANSGFAHISLPLSSFTSNLIMTDPSFSIGIGIVNYGNPMATQSGEEILMDNVQITMTPEPGAFGLLVTGLGILAGWRGYRRAS